MNPFDLAKNNTESGHQKAFFAWCAVARRYGFKAADDMSSYKAPGWLREREPVAALEWIHAIPNGGARDPVTAARMKAEGVKPGIPDIFLPFPNKDFNGLYLELKKEGRHAVSKEQKEFASYAQSVYYAHVVVVGWQQAIAIVRAYLQNA